MDARKVLNALRRGESLSAEAVDWFARALADEGVSDAQVGAFAMGVCHAPLSAEARVALTLAMRDSGEVLSWDLPGPVVDKHSTGGVGDCVSLVLAPALAACGVFVPMISGRGLGHTGGTLDKLEAIPGFNPEISVEKLQRITREVGCAIASASVDVAPADKRLYAVRDVTGTVESLDLITASILSKKLAAGLQGLVLDVKCGAGAFMKTPEAARELAGSLVETANGAGCATRALITDMSQPLVRSAGNAVEVTEAMDTLTGSGASGPLSHLSAKLGGELLAMVGVTRNAYDGADMILDKIRSGHAAERMGRMVAAMGGPSDFLSRWRDRLPAAPATLRAKPEREGYVEAIDTEALGLAVVAMGGGRKRARDRINPAVGLSQIAQIGDRVGAERPLAKIHAARRSEAEAFEPWVRAAFQLSETPVNPPKLVLGRVE
ncbi:thymidine phosphorylase [Vannielia litorea]|uniref:Thymidine phosphorylase n=1 Tax=Vannielia litorea TaxID=1217970 RepID=A0A1N6GY75_9RHOB|nr:thymidine phosphorylase [Vannielia litorea]SIO12508.1 thymidine phosphorylase [Vannielia litorea]